IKAALQLALLCYTEFISYSFYSSTPHRTTKVLFVRGSYRPAGDNGRDGAEHGEVHAGRCY
uniref:Uncharacterized protein n=1 Tax=Aegilops tauschii subsp. strangulata TaxID=200361 RepID=A0A453QEU4_AEGTS